MPIAMPMRRAALACLFTASLALPAMAAEPVDVFENARVFDGSRDLGLRSIVVAEGRITHVDAQSPHDLPPGTRRHDLRGKWLVPGLVAAHSHVANTEGTAHGDRFYTRDNVVRDLRAFQRFGVTTVAALGMNGPAFAAVREEVRDDPSLGAQFYGAGAGVGVPDGAPPAQVMGLANDPVARPADADQARAAVRAQKAAGIDLVKLWVDDLGGKAPMMRPEVYRAAIDEAHAQGLKVAAHIHDLAPAQDLVANGLDIVAHGIRDQPVPPALVEAMRKAGTWYIPTINIDEANYAYAENPAWLEDPFLRAALPPAVLAQWSDPAWRTKQLSGANIPGARSSVANNLANLRTLHAAGVRIGFGTDSGAMPQRVIGFAEHRELELFVQAGLTPAQALSAATRDAAELLGLEDRGRIAEGQRADFVVLAADPLADILNTRKIDAVWQAGTKVAGPVVPVDADAEKVAAAAR